MIHTYKFDNGFAYGVFTCEEKYLKFFLDSCIRFKSNSNNQFTKEDFEIVDILPDDNDILRRANIGLNPVLTTEPWEFSDLSNDVISNYAYELEHYKQLLNIPPYEYPTIIEFYEYLNEQNLL